MWIERRAKRFQFRVAVSLVLLLPANSQGRAAYKGVAQMIETAEVIAVVEITHVESVSVNGKFWTYGQKASAKIEKVLKGKLSGRVKLYGDENFICARCHFEPGRYVVFLDRDGALLTGNNWHLSARKITKAAKEKVEWFDEKKKLEENLEEKEALLSDVLTEIQAGLAKPIQPKP